MRESIFNIKVKVNGENYIYNSWNNGIIQLNDEDLHDENNLKYLLDEKYYVEDDYDELDELAKEINKEINGDLTELTLTLSMTQRCNFKCTYCYQEREPKSLNLENSKQLINSIKEILDDNKSIEVMKIHYFGGEPLLNYDIIRYLDNEFKEISTKSKVKYEAYITTNGSMLNEDILSSIKFKDIQLTFDGLEDNHNKLRISDTFKFNDLINVIGVVLKYCDKLILRYNLCEENKYDLNKFIDLIADKYPLEKITFSIAPMVKFKDNAEFNMLSFEEFCKFSLEGRLRAQKNGKKLLLPKRINHPCSFISGKALSVSPELFINRCEGKIENTNEKLSKNSFKYKPEFKIQSECAQCKVLPLCLGGCPLNAKYRSSCNPEKNLIEDLIINEITINNN